jgi:hypothetical protein
MYGTFFPELFSMGQTTYKKLIEMKMYGTFFPELFSMGQTTYKKLIEMKMYGTSSQNSSQWDKQL